MLNITPATLGYNNKPILEFSGMNLQKGGQCMLTGPSGKGKTTLLYAIAGLNMVIKGSIIIDGTDISKLSPRALDHFRGKNIGIIFQTLHLVKSLTVMQNLLLAPYIANTNENKEYAEILLKKLGLEDKANALPEELSQGQAQRIAIARAVINKPKLILADEPTSSLDDNNCNNVIELIKQVANDSGASLVISTHDARVKGHFKEIIEV